MSTCSLSAATASRAEGENGRLNLPIVFILAVNVPIAGLALMRLLFRMPLLFGPVHIAFLEMVIDPVCALVFEAEREEVGVMQRPPRPADEPLFSWPTVVWSLLQGCMVLGIAGSAALFAPGYGLDPDQVRGLAFATLVLGVVALILIDRSNSNTILSALLRPNRALAVVLPIVASLLAVTLFWAPARDLFRFGVLEGLWLAVPPLAGIGVLLALEALKPLWRMVLSAREPAARPAVKAEPA